MSHTLSVLFLGLALIACGGAGASDDTTTADSSGGEHAHSHTHADGTTHDHAHGEADHDHQHDHEGHAEHHERSDEHHHEMSAGLRAFHDVLAPVYHMDAGDERATATCEATPRMGELAPDVSVETVTATETLGRACDAGDHAQIESALEGVHDAFHHAMEAESGE